MKLSRTLDTADNFHPVMPLHITEEEYLLYFAAKAYNPSHDISGL
jgi:hypothetical protein